MEGEKRTVSRREMIKTSATAAATATMVGGLEQLLNAAETPPKSAKDIQFAIIGTGHQGRIDMGFAKQAGCKFVAVADIVDANRKNGLEMAEKGARGYKDYREMLEKEKDIDAVVVTVPPKLHAEVSITASDAGKHVFCEKMMALTTDDCRAMIKAAEKAGKLLQIGHQRRYNIFYHHALQLIKQGTIGKITHVWAVWNRNDSWRRPVPKIDFDPRPHGWYDLEHLVNWRLYKESSLGLLSELTSHQMDAIDWFLGARPLTVTGFAGLDYWKAEVAKDKRDIWDNVNLVYEYPNGVKVMAQSIMTNAHEGYYEKYLGTGGTIILSRESDAMMFREAGAKKMDWEALAHQEKTADGKAKILLSAYMTPPKEPGVSIGADDAKSPTKKTPYQVEFESFLKSIETGDKPFCDGEVGFHSAAAMIRTTEALEKRVIYSYTDDDWKV